MAPRTPASERGGNTGWVTRIGSLRRVLLILALVPSMALITLWTVSFGKLYADWRQQSAQNRTAERAGQPSLTVFINLQAERRLSAEALADPAAPRQALIQQRQRTDSAVQAFEALSGLQGADAMPGLQPAVTQTRTEMQRLTAARSGVDNRTASQQATFDYYTALIETDLRVFNALSAVDDGQLHYLSRPLIDALWGAEMLSREDAMLSRGWAAGRLSGEEHRQLVGWIGAQQVILADRVAPYLSTDDARNYTEMTSGRPWQGKASVEQALLIPVSTARGAAPLPARLHSTWRRSTDVVDQQFQELLRGKTASLAAFGQTRAKDLLTLVATTSAVGLAGVLLVVLINLRLTSWLRNRIFALRDRALAVQTRLPQVVEQARRGEAIDTAAELPELREGGDELSQLSQALNQAGHTVVETAVGQIELYRGFERLLQRIARRTQLLIGLQLKKLDEMERRHEDPQVLEGLFDLDHLTARLRRYEENLVILAGGQPQRRWRKPVQLLDVLRSAQGEVQDYRRIQIEVDGRPWLVERAVGPVAHILAELMENAAAFSKPPTPVEVRAAAVGRGLAVEIEDRGLGMDPEQYQAANALMADPPRMDVMSRAEDVRLGLYVVARLAAGLDLRVEFRPSAFGGTRVIVFIPAELVASQLALAGAPAAEGPTRPAGVPAPGPVAAAPVGAITLGGLPVRSKGRSLVPVTGQQPPAEPAAVPVAEPAAVPTAVPTDSAADRPLPRRVRQASLAAELRDPGTGHSQGQGPASQGVLPLRSGTGRSAAAIGAFQRQSRIARERANSEDRSATDGDLPDRTPPRMEDRG